MGVAFYIVSEREIEGFDIFVNGKAVGHANEKTLERLCASLGVKPLTSFYSQAPEELAGFLGEDADIEGLPATEWFDPGEGLVTVKALHGYLLENPGSIANSEAIAQDLAEYQRVLTRLGKEGVRWYLALDI